MDISDSNLTIKNVIKTALGGSNSFVSIRDINEFGSYKYFINPLIEEYLVQFYFYGPDFDKFIKAGIEEFFKTEYKDFTYELNRKCCNGKDYSVCFDINFSKFADCFKKLPKNATDDDIAKHEASIQNQKKELEKFAENVSDRFARFRCDIYAQLVRIYMESVKNAKPFDSLKLGLSKNNALYLIPDKEKLAVIFGLNFQDKTDINLSKLFLKELEDAKFGFGGSIDIKYHLLNIPETITNIESKAKEDFNAGFFQFSKLLLLLM